MSQSVLERPRDLEGDIYDLIDEQCKHYDKAFYKDIIVRFGSIRKFFESDLWKTYVSHYRKTHEKED